ncbi:MAG TPA: SHOCT domain-containing protein [Gammaproteobacteria bacterium]|nr:SHOCT domain-containing protein [Gammaproteobacteria bacterium]
MKYLAVAMTAMILTGCATSGKINRVEVGMSKDEVIGVMGSPVSVSAKGRTEYLNYKLSETDDDAFRGFTTPYFVRLIDGKVDSYGRTGDFDSTSTPTVRIETDEKVNVSGESDLYTELRRLKGLRDEGILSESEYQSQKKKVLSNH